MSGEQIHFQVPPKLFGVAQMIRQWIPDCWSGDRKCTAPRAIQRRLVSKNESKFVLLDPCKN